MPGSKEEKQKAETGTPERAVFSRFPLFSFPVYLPGGPDMSNPTETQTERAPDSSTCVARSVVDALSKEPSLEAVTINRTQQKISVATLGKTDEPRLTETVSSRIQKAYEKGVTEHCLLLEGQGDCHTCDLAAVGAGTAAHHHPARGRCTTIARVTCPTAPKFWRWRDLPWPKVVQRDVEFLEEAEHIEEHINEWKPQLVAAILCGLCGLAGYFSRQPPSVTDRTVSARLPGRRLVHRARKSGNGCKSAPSTCIFSCSRSRSARPASAPGRKGATLLFLFSLSGALEHFALGRTQKEIRSLFREAPKVATVLDERPAANAK